MQLMENIDECKIVNQEYKGIVHAGTSSYIARFLNATSIWNSDRNDASAQPWLSVDTWRVVRHTTAITADLIWFG